MRVGVRGLAREHLEARCARAGNIASIEALLRLTMPA
jgi:hypothetical protein